MFLWEVMARSVDGMMGFQSHGPLEVEEAIKAQIPRRHQGSDEDPTFFFLPR